MQGNRDKLANAWSELASEDKQAVLTTPALWIAVPAASLAEP